MYKFLIIIALIGTSLGFGQNIATFEDIKSKLNEAHLSFKIKPLKKIELKNSPNVRDWETRFIETKEIELNYRFIVSFDRDWLDINICLVQNNVLTDRCNNRVKIAHTKTFNYRAADGIDRSNLYDYSIGVYQIEVDGLPHDLGSDIMPMKLVIGAQGAPWNYSMMEYEHISNDVWGDYVTAIRMFRLVKRFNNYIKLDAKSLSLNRKPFRGVKGNDPMFNLFQNSNRSKVRNVILRFN